MSWNEPIDFFARGEQAIELLAPIYNAMDEFMRGEFFVPEKLRAYTQGLDVNPVGLRGSVNRPLEVNPPARSTPMVTCNYRDLLVAVRLNSKRPQIHLQVSDFKGAAQDKVHLFLCRDETRQAWVKKHWMNKSCLLVSDSALATAEAIVSYVKEHSTLRSVTHMEGESIGIVYMVFGEKAAAAVRASVMSLRRVGLIIPVCVVGDTPVKGLQFVEWTGESPFDAHERNNFQFRAGRIKPKLYALSPFERTLYIDADTEFMEDILPGFAWLSDFDIAVARETITLAQLYNKKLAGWEINLIERDATVREIGNENQYFLNSGMLFFRKCAAMEMAMQGWHEEWLRWRQWDEQLALMRAFYKTPELKVKVLEPQWNYPHRHKGIVIFHNYGRGVVRMNVEEVSPQSVTKEHKGNLGDASPQSVTMEHKGNLGDASPQSVTKEHKGNLDDASPQSVTKEHKGNLDGASPQSVTMEHKGNLGGASTPIPPPFPHLSTDGEREPVTPPPAPPQMEEHNLERGAEVMA